MLSLTLLSRIQDALPPLTRAFDEAPDPLATHLVVTSDERLSEWLRERCLRGPGGVFSQGELLPAHRALPRILEASLGRPLKRWGKRQLRWPLLSILPGWARRCPEARPLRRLFSDAQGQLSLSGRALGGLDQLSASLERLLQERPEWLRAWADGETVGVEDTAPWWPSLWREIAPLLGQDHPAAGLFESLETALAAPNCPLMSRYHRISYLGVRRLLPSSAQLLKALATCCPVDIYLLAPETIGVAPATNPLIHELGAALIPPARQLIDLTSQVSRAPSPPQSAALLHQLQHALAVDEGFTPLEAPRPIDESIAFHSAPTPLRQVEALYQALAQALREHPALSPRDLLVVCPQLDRFAPLIPAVFSGTEGRLAASLDDPSELNPYLSLLDELITLAGSRLYRAEVMQLYKHPAVLEQSGAQLEEALTVERLLERAGVRWGLNAAHRTRYGLPEEELFSWRMGLDRLALGLVSGARPVSEEGLAPLDPGEGRDALARFFTFFDQLEGCIARLQRRQPPRSWLRTLITALESLAAPVEGQRGLYQGAFSALRECLEGAPEAGQLTPRAVQQLLRQLGGIGHHHETGERVRFLSLSQGAGIPAPVVALLGADVGSFPRWTQTSRFDLVARQPPESTVDPAADQRAALLELILAAEHRLLIVWSGSKPAQREESLRPAAEPVEVLRRFLGEWGSGRHAIGDEGERAGARWLAELTRRHPLHPFSPGNFVTDEPGMPGRATLSHEPRWLAGAERLQRPERWTALEPFAARAVEVTRSARRQLSLDALIQFWENPSKAYLQRGLGVRLPNEEAPASAREPIELSGLEGWQIRHRCLDLLREARSPLKEETLHRQLDAEGLLPPGTIGQVAFERAWEEVSLLHRRFEGHRGVRSQTPLQAQLELDGGDLLTLRCPDLYERQLLIPTLSKHRSRALLRGEKLLRPWLQHLALSASAIPYDGACLIATDGDFEAFPPLERDAARALLSQLSAQREAGLQLPLRFDPGLALNWLQLSEDPKRLKKIEERWERGYGLKNDLYVEQSFDQRSEQLWRDPLSGAVSEEFDRLSQLIFSPFSALFEDEQGEGAHG